MDCRPNPNYNGLSMAMALIRARTSDLQTVLNESRKGADERPEVSTAFWNLAEFIKSEWRREKGE